MLRGLADGSYSGPIPRAEDLYRFQLEAVMYVDRNGFASPREGPMGLGAWAGANTLNPLARTAEQPVKQRCEQMSTEYIDKNSTKPTQPNEFSPMNFLAAFPGFSFGTPALTLAKSGVSGQLPMHDANDGFAIYNNLTMDVGMPARLSEEDFLNSILFGLTPPPLAMGDTSAVQDAELQASYIVTG